MHIMLSGNDTNAWCIIPVVFLTSHIKAKYSSKCFVAHCNVYVVFYIFRVTQRFPSEYNIKSSQFQFQSALLIN